MEVPWLEKYRPQSLSDVVGNVDSVERLSSIACHGNLPHLILSGPPGCGKTTAILALGRALMRRTTKEEEDGRSSGDRTKNHASSSSTSKMHPAILELNASDDRGIDTVRSKIKFFAQQKITMSHPGQHKLIILDEADAMTVGAQQALRRTMEIYSSTTRFAFICNQSTKIIEPIQSRCAILRFSLLKEEEMLKRLLEICEAEQVNYTQDGLSAILFTAQGDMRQALNNLQATHSGFDRVTDENVFKVCDQPHPTVVKAMMQDCIEYKVKSAESRLSTLWKSGYSALDVIGTIFRVCKAHEMPERMKLEFMKEIGRCHMAIADGSTSMLQLHGLAARLCSTAQNHRDASAS